MENSLKAGITTAFEAKQLAMQIERQEKELKYLAAQTRKLNVDTKVAEKGIPESDLKNKIYNKLSPIIDRVINFGSSQTLYAGIVEEFVGNCVRVLIERVPDIPSEYRDWETDRKSTRLNSSHRSLSRMPSSA